MARKGPGKHYRKGLSFVEIARLFPDDKTAEQWFIETRWPDGVRCPECGSLNIQDRKTRKPQPYRCRDCRKDFSVKTGTLMHNSPLGLQTWVITIYLLATNLKGVSSLKLHRDLGITQKSAWFLAQRIRETWVDDIGPFSGPVEIDESYFGGKEANKHSKKRLKAGRGSVGKTAVAGAKDRVTNAVSAVVVDNTDAETLQGFVADRTAPDATVYTDEAKAYKGIPYDHESVRHSVGEYVVEDCHTNGIESFWSMLKRAHKGTFHKLSPKHLQRYVDEFSGRHNARNLDTIDQMVEIAHCMDGKQLRYQDLIADNGKDSGARS